MTPDVFGWPQLRVADEDPRMERVLAERVVTIGDAPYDDWNGVWVVDRITRDEPACTSVLHLVPASPRTRLRFPTCERAEAARRHAIRDAVTIVRQGLAALCGRDLAAEMRADLLRPMPRAQDEEKPSDAAWSREVVVHQHDGRVYLA